MALFFIGMERTLSSNFSNLKKFDFLRFVPSLIFYLEKPKRPKTDANSGTYFKNQNILI